MIVKVTCVNGNGKRDWDNKEESMMNKLKVIILEVKSE